MKQNNLLRVDHPLVEGGYDRGRLKNRLQFYCTVLSLMISFVTDAIK